MHNAAVGGVRILCVSLGGFWLYTKVQVMLMGIMHLMKAYKQAQLYMHEDMPTHVTSATIHRLITNEVLFSYKEKNVISNYCTT